MAHVELQNVSKRFSGHTAVDGVSLDLRDGEIVALLGPSGCGKTTTLRLIAGFEHCDDGFISIDGSDVSRLPPYERAIGLVFQDYALFPHMTVAQNVEYGMRQRGVPAAERARRRAAMLALVRLAGLDARRPSALSGGQQQRVALARALVISPKLVLLDEPLSNLDAKLRETLRRELREILREAGATTLIVTHDQDEAMQLADRIAVMNAGKIEQIGAPREIYEAPLTRFVAEFVGKTIWFDGAIEGEGAPISATAGPLCRFRTADGALLHACRPTRQAERYGLALRPERVALAAGAEHENAWPGTVEAIEYFGEKLIYRVRLATAALLEIPVRADGADLPAKGASVTLGARAADCRLTVS
jgi:ABC-type Fe3+/spermidine/putrescine transport system ATPase subunit